MANEAVQHCPYSGWTFMGMNASVCHCRHIRSLQTKLEELQKPKRSQDKNVIDGSIPVPATVDVKAIHRAVAPLLESNSDEIPRLSEDQIEWLQAFLNGNDSTDHEQNTGIDSDQESRSSSSAESMDIDEQRDSGKRKVGRPIATDKHKCIKCGKYFDQACHFSEHIKLDHSFPCKLCKLSFTAVRFLTAHKFEAHPETREDMIFCPSCQKPFSNKESLRKHKSVCKGNQ